MTIDLDHYLFFFRFLKFENFQSFIIYKFGGSGVLKRANFGVVYVAELEKFDFQKLI